MQEGDENFHLTFEGPSEEELNKCLDKLGDKVEEISEELEEIADDLRNDLEDVFEQAMEVVDMVGNKAKSVYDTIPEDQKFWEHDEEEVDVEEASGTVAARANLASKKSKAAASSNAGMYAGISFGVIGLVAAGAMFAAATKKQVSDNEFCLL